MKLNKKRLESKHILRHQISNLSSVQHKSNLNAQKENVKCIDLSKEFTTVINKNYKLLKALSK